MKPAVLFFLVAACLLARSKDCAPCHRAIFEKYQRTPMARSSGVTGRGLPADRFTSTGFEYQIADNSLTMSGARKTMAYFVGSGATARSFLLASDGFLFEAPVAFYSQTGRWALAPGYERYAYPYVTRPVPPSCLTCHASFLRPVAGTQNRYESPPFEEDGVSCERCHGAGEEHFLNPAKLVPDRRDSVCAQCHLSGAARVMRAGADWRSYRPGGRLSDSVITFVRAGTSPAMRVTSHVENLAQSRCKQVSGDRLWCGTCHDPHELRDRASLRAKCAGCHVPGSCKGTRAAAADCLGCHMPKSTVTDAQHVVYSDHSIPRRPRKATAADHSGDLVAFGGVRASDRDLGLAYAMVGQPERAVKLLEGAESAAPEDVEVLVYLAEIYRSRNQESRAAPLYERAMRIDASQLTALVGLGAIRLQQGQSAEAIRLWVDALARNPGLDLTRTNLAMAQWQTGDRAGAVATLEKGLALSPAFRPASDLLKRLRDAR